MTREPLLQITWTDPVTGRRGYVVIDSLSYGGSQRRAAAPRGLHARRGARAGPGHGPQGGVGLQPDRPVRAARRRQGRHRLQPARSRGARRAEALPHGRTAGGARAVEHRRGLRPAAGDDRRARRRGGAADDDRAGAAASSRIPTPRADGWPQAFDVDVDGIALPDLVGGYGVAEAALACAERDGSRPGATRRRPGLRLHRRRRPRGTCTARACAWSRSPTGTA